MTYGQQNGSGRGKGKKGERRQNKNTGGCSAGGSGGGSGVGRGQGGNPKKELVFSLVGGNRRGCKVWVLDPTPAEHPEDKILLEFSNELKIYMTKDEAVCISTGLLNGYMKAFELEENCDTHNKKSNPP